MFQIPNPVHEKLAPKFYGADGSPIANVVALVAEGCSDDGHATKIDFGVTKVTRPLSSVFKMIADGHNVEFSERGGTIK